MPEVKSLSNVRAADTAHDAACKDSADVLQSLVTCPNGLSEEEAAVRLEKYGPNEIAREKKESWLQRLYIAARNPLVIPGQSGGTGQATP